MKSFLTIYILFVSTCCIQAQDTIYQKYDDGRLRAKGIMIENRREGDWYFYHPNGVCSAEETFVHDVLNGKSIYYDSLSHIDAIVQWKSGAEQDSAWYYYSSGKLKRSGIYNYGMYAGEWVTLYETGIVKIKGSYKNATPNGIWHFYNEQGIITEEYTYVNGIREGPAKLYNMKGQLIASGNMEKDDEKGEWKYYSKRGKVKKTIVF